MGLKGDQGEVGKQGQTGPTGPAGPKGELVSGNGYFLVRTQINWLQCETHVKIIECKLG